MASPAVALFVDRAQAVRPDFALTQGNAAAVVEICRRLEGLPLAIELAAAGTRLLDPGALLARLAASLDVLSTSAADLPERQQTLRATVDWSVSLLDDAERSLLEVVSVFEPGWTIEAAAQVAEPDRGHGAGAERGPSPAQPHQRGQRPRRPVADARHHPRVRRREARRAARRGPDPAPPRRLLPGAGRTGRPGPCAAPDTAGGWSGWTQTSATWPPPSAGTSATIAGRCPTCCGSCGHSGSCAYHMNEARTWIDQLLPSADSLEAPTPAPSCCVQRAVIALEIGDDSTALAARQRLAANAGRDQRSPRTRHRPAGNSVTLCMIAFARLALRRGRPRSGGAARRGGRRPADDGSACGPWPMLRQGETELTSQIRQAAGPRPVQQNDPSRLPAQPAGGSKRHLAPARHRHGQPGTRVGTRLRRCRGFGFVPVGAAAIVWTVRFKNGGCRGQAADGEGRGDP